ncbi:MAG: LPP20 family lipoprotein [Candidatus Cloacimonadota bacterium]|nr:LPP20 family lipoprotein [Candidatus Cloacimonadota bacterium]
MKRLFQILLLICLFFQVNLLHAKKAPNWVTNRPIDKEFYIGIGHASKIKGSNDHIEKATSEALKNLASEITVNISGEVVSSMIEKSGILEEELKSKIRSTTEAELDGYELVEQWQDKKEYWIYYRLSKIKYQLAREEKINKAVSLALDLFSKAKKSEQNREYDKALLLFLQSLKPIEKYIGETLETKYLGQSIYLNNEIYLSIQNILSNIELESVTNNIEAKRNKAVKQSIKITAYYLDTEQIPIPNLPILFGFKRGEGDLIKNVKTNMYGVASSKISKITSSEKMQILNAELDISKLINQDSTSFVYQNILKTFPMPSTRIILNVTGLLIFIESEEINLGKELKVLHIEPKIKESFSEKGFSFTDDMAGADIYIMIKARSREGSEMFGMYSTFVDVTVSALEMSSGEEIYKNVFNNVSGQGLNAEKAGLKAFENVAEKISENMVPKIIQIVGQ